MNFQTQDKQDKRSTNSVEHIYGIQPTNTTVGIIYIEAAHIVMTRTWYLQTNLQTAILHPHSQYM